MGKQAYSALHRNHCDKLSGPFVDDKGDHVAAINTATFFVSHSASISYPFYPRIRSVSAAACR
jgi:hypothetical protein